MPGVRARPNVMGFRGVLDDGNFVHEGRVWGGGGGGLSESAGFSRLFWLFIVLRDVRSLALAKRLKRLEGSGSKMNSRGSQIGSDVNAPRRGFWLATVGSLSTIPIFLPATMMNLFGFVVWQGAECGVWQHCPCVGIKEGDQPKEFFCEFCRAALADPFWAPVDSGIVAPSVLRPTDNRQLYQGNAIDLVQSTDRSFLLTGDQLNMLKNPRREYELQVRARGRQRSKVSGLLTHSGFLSTTLGQALVRQDEATIAYGQGSGEGMYPVS